MIIEELGKFIIIDEIRHNATSSELYFLSCLLGNEMLSLADDWQGRIYTSQFIYDVLLKKKPKVPPKCFRVLKANVATKFKSKDKVIWVTMFESDEINNSVMFHFDDSINKYLYTGVFPELCSCFRNVNFMQCIQKGIDYVYMHTLLSNSYPYICTDDTVDEIKSISLKHPNSKLAIIMPNFGYEKLLVELIQAFPQNVYPTKTQRYILTKLGYGNFLSSNCQSCGILIFIPGIFTEYLETDLITIYISEGDVPTLDNEYGVYLRQWSPYLSLMDQQVLMEKIKPNHIIPIERYRFQENFGLPFNLRWYAKKTSSKTIKQEAIDPEYYPENNSFSSIETTCSAATRIQNCSPAVSLPSTELFCPQTETKKPGKLEKTKDSSRDKVSNRNKVDTKLPIAAKCTNLIKQRTRIIRQRASIVFTDSDDDFG